MLTGIKNLIGFRIRATDGDIGKAYDVFFDDRVWTVQYLAVDTHVWLPGRKVLVSPVALSPPDWQEQRLPVNLTRAMVKESPDIDVDKPVSRQQQVRLAQYYGWPETWAAGPQYTAAPLTAVSPQLPAGIEEAEGDVHLRSAKEVTGYYLQAQDGELGHVDDFVVDDRLWVLRYVVVDTRNWLPGRKVLIAPDWVSRVAWLEHKLYVDLPREVIQTSPEYDPDSVLERDYEESLYRHYSKVPYWQAQSEE